MVIEGVKAEEWFSKSSGLWRMWCGGDTLRQGAGLPRARTSAVLQGIVGGMFHECFVQLFGKMISGVIERGKCDFV